jgi:serine/threonine-protein kinase
MNNDSLETEVFDASRARRKDELCDQFESAWTRHQPRPRIETYLGTTAGAERSELLQELLALEVDLRRARGEQPTFEEYEQRFPDHVGRIQAVLFDAGCLPLKRIGRYQVRRRLGGGAFGQVYLCYDDRADREVAIKVPRRDRLTSAEAEQALLHEAQSVARLNHAGIVPLYDVGTHQGQCFLVFKLVDGMSLAELMQQGPVPQDQAARMVASVADTLHYFHGKDLFHRDIKPANILVDGRGQTYLADFGLAVRDENLARERGRRSGTYPYMSPEQVRGEGDRIDGRSDNYSLGVVLYELLCQHRPFRGTKSEVMDQILHRDPRPLREINHAVDPELERICLKAMAKQVTARHLTAGDMAEELRRAAGPPPAPEKKGWLRRHARAVWLTTAALVLALLAGKWLSWPSNDDVLAVRPSILDTVAVVPLESADDDPSLRFLSQGITESLLHSLSQLPALKVRPLSAVERYRGREVNAQSVGQELQVQAVVTVRVSKHGEDLAISVDLIDARHNAIVWGEKYRHKLVDIFVLQDKMATQIAQRLKPRLTAEDENRLTRHGTKDTKAYQLYLLGRYHANHRGEAEIRNAIEYFNEAIKADPQYAQAYAGLADSYGLLVTYAGQPPKAYYPTSKEMALKALELDASLAEAHTSLAGVYTDFDWDWPAAEEHYKQAMQLNPNYVTAHHGYSRYLSWMGRHDEAVQEARVVRELDPLSVLASNNLALVFYCAGDYDQAIAQANLTLKMDPKFSLAHAVLGWAYTEIGKYQAAQDEFAKRLDLTRDLTHATSIGYLHAKLGHKAEARKTLAELAELAKRRWVEPTDRAAIHAALGEKDQAFACLEEAYAERDPGLVLLGILPWWDSLRPDPRFVRLLQRMNLPPTTGRAGSALPDQDN